MFSAEFITFMSRTKIQPCNAPCRFPTRANVVPGCRHPDGKHSVTGPRLHQRNSRGIRPSPLAKRSHRGRAFLVNAPLPQLRRTETREIMAYLSTPRTNEWFTRSAPTSVLPPSEGNAMTRTRLASTAQVPEPHRLWHFSFPCQVLYCPYSVRCTATLDL